MTSCVVRRRRSVWMPTPSRQSCPVTAMPMPSSGTSAKRPPSGPTECRSSSWTARSASREPNRPTSSRRSWIVPGPRRTRGSSTSADPSPPMPVVLTAARSEEGSDPRAGPRGNRPSDPFGHREDLVGHETVRLAVDGVGRLGVGRVDEAEDLALVLADPVTQVLHAVLLLRLQVGGVRGGDVVRGDVAVPHRVYIHEQCHDRLLCPHQQGRLSAMHPENSMRQLGTSGNVPRSVNIPARRAAATAAERFPSPSLRRIAETWWSTVLGERNRRPASSALVHPSASSASTSSSREVSPAAFCCARPRGPRGTGSPRS